MVIDNATSNNAVANQVERIVAAAKEGTALATMSQQPPISPGSAGGYSNHAFFPSTQATPDHANANAMLAARKQQLAHLQSLERQQQQVLQQMSHRSAAAAATTASTQPPLSTAMSPVGAGQGYAQDGRDDRFSASGLRSGNPGSHPASPMGSHVGPGNAVSFHRPAGASAASPRRPVFECDYDTNPTELYLSVQRKDWDGAVERSATCPHEASTWVSRKEADGKLRWRLLPLHAAIIFRAPERTVSALLFAFAQGAACKDDQGMLPLHLAFRNGCDEGVVHLLLMAYPQSVDVQDRKGRTPMVLAQQSTHQNRELYIRALERGPAYYAVANAAKDGIVNSPGAALDAMVPAMPSAGASYSASLIGAMQQQGPPYAAGASSASGASSLPVMASEATAAVNAAESIGRSAGGKDSGRVAELEAELAKTQETSQILVDHVNSLEAQLASRSDTERFLATKIANLDSQLKEANSKLEAAAAEVEAKKEELTKKDEEVGERAKSAEEEVEKLQVALADKKEAELKNYKLTNKERFDLEERVETSERECAAAQANAAVLEAQLKKKIETEQSLASQVSMLASQLASSASSSSEAASAYQRKCESLTAENKKLQAHIEELEGKLGTVATALDAMAAEQERIVEAATKHEKTMAACAKAHQTIIQDTTRQETLLEDAAKEREQIVSILMRQAEDAERTMADREKVLEAVKAQEKDIAVAVQERDSVVDSVNKQREYMDFMLNGELQFLKRTNSEEACELVNKDKMEDMERTMQAYMDARPEEEDAPKDGTDDQADVIAAAFGNKVEEEEAQDEGADKLAVTDQVDEAETGEATNIAAGKEDKEEEEISEEDMDDAALEEAANAVKEAMKAAENAIEQDGGEDHDEDGREEESDEEEEAAADDGYETPAEGDDADIDAAISAASSDEEDEEE